MNPNMFLFSLTLSQLLYFTVAEDKDHIFEVDNDPQRYFTELKDELNTFGNDMKIVGERIKSFRNELEQQFLAELADAHHDLDAEMKPLSHYKDSALKMLRKVRVRGASGEEQVNAVVTFLTEVISQEIQNSADIAPTEMAQGTMQYICMSLGRVSGLRSLKHARTKIITDTDSVSIHLIYVFKNLHVHYGLFYLQIWPWPAMRGELDIDFGKNEIEIVINLPRVETLMNKILRNECIIRLKDFSVHKLEYRNSRLTGDSSAGYDVVSSLMDTFLKMNQSMMKMKFESKALEEVRRTGNLVCNDNTFTDLILSKGGSLIDEVESDAFKLHCGSGGYHNNK